MPPITMPTTYDPGPTRSADNLVALIEAHRTAVLASGTATDADRELWAAIGFRATPTLRLIEDAPVVDEAATWFDAPQDWDSFWNR